MRCKWILSLCFSGLIFLSSQGWATPILNLDGSDGFEDVNDTPYAHYANTGELIGVFGGNDNNLDTLEAQINTWLEDIKGLSTISLGASDIELTVTGWDGTQDVDLGTSGTGDGGKVDNIAGGFLSGTWTVSPGTSTLGIYSVKGGPNGYALYWVDPASNSGSWSTYDLGLNSGDQGYSISHFTGIFQGTTPPPGPNPVPEPATMLLLGLGLLGVTGVGRKIKNRL